MGGTIPLPPLCACTGMSWCDHFYLTLNMNVTWGQNKDTIIYYQLFLNTLPKNKIGQH
jgi:hypothetical protein